MHRPFFQGIVQTEIVEKEATDYSLIKCDDNMEYSELGLLMVEGLDNMGCQ